MMYTYIHTPLTTDVCYTKGLTIYKNTYVLFILIMKLVQVPAEHCNMHVALHYRHFFIILQSLRKIQHAHYTSTKIVVNFSSN